MGRYCTNTPSADADGRGVVAAFRERRAAIENAGAAEQRAFQVTLATLWKGFIAQHGSPDRFGGLSRAAQLDYFKDLLRSQAALLAQEDFHTAVPLEMLNMYLAAIIGKCRDFASEAATFLDHHARQGHRTAALATRS